MSATALIVIDLQNDYFPSGHFPLVGIEAATANAALVLATARARGDLVVHVRHEALEPDATFFVPGTEGAAINAAVAPRPGEAVVVKNNINAFLGTDLKATLDAAGVGKVVIVGAMSHMCVDAAARAAADFGYEITVVHDAVATRDLEFGGTTVPAAQVQAAFIAALAFGYGAVVSAGDYIAG
ncbi:cysteine hydrolase family protein [Ancylobacter lacus]|uniref:cysteine hydrolase family protein n=1 Tax=Ancylobacter lacus TaxID=2579970 RepID=UPI001BCC66D4|nr:cysteine hydrolase family protein [Ancylobacter lacus]MBS7539122.1 cysteine hydrolase [Ancylobacter lacus]